MAACHCTMINIMSSACRVTIPRTMGFCCINPHVSYFLAGVYAHAYVATCAHSSSISLASMMTPRYLAWLTCSGSDLLHFYIKYLHGFHGKMFQRSLDSGTHISFCNLAFNYTYVRILHGVERPCQMEPQSISEHMQSSLQAAEAEHL